MSHPSNDDEAPRYLERALALAFDSDSLSQAASSPAPPVEAPTRAGRFLILAEIARGGGGIVYRAHDPELERDVALKVLRGGAREGEEARDRFQREVLVAGQLQHPCFVPVHESGTLKNGEPYYVMRLVEGSTLTELLRETAGNAARPNQRRTLMILEQVSQAVGFAHSRGMVHRDLKPSNIMVGAFGEVQVMDWGLAKLLQEPETDLLDRALEESPSRSEPDTEKGSGSSYSIAGAVMGTPWYMPPEQARGETDRIDERSDVFALGAILCQILTGEPPYAGDHREALCSAREARLQPALDALRNSGNDSELVELAMRSLSPEIEDRPSNAMEFAEALTAYFVSQDGRVRRAELAAEASRVEAREERRRRKLSLALFGAIALAFVSGGAGLWLREKDARERVEALTEEVQSAHDSALTAFVRAQSLRPRDMRAWNAASLEVEQASRLLDTGRVEPGLRERVLDLSIRIADGYDQAHQAEIHLERDQQMLERLDQVGAPLAPSSFKSAHEDYIEAFREYKLDWKVAVPAELRERAIAPQLASALGRWALFFSVLSGRDADERVAFLNKMLERGLELDADPQRTAIRSALLARDLQSLEAVAETSTSTEFSAETFALLAGGLRILGNFQASEAVYRRGLFQHPGDCWLNYQLGYLIMGHGARNDEALYHAYAALGACGSNVRARHLLGKCLERNGQPEAALTQFEFLVQAQPDNGHFHAHVASNLIDLERIEEAESVARVATELTPEDAFPWNILTYLELSLGRRHSHLALARRAHELNPGSYALLRRYANALQDLTLDEESKRIFESILVHDVENVSKRDRYNHALNWLTYANLLERFAELEASKDAHRMALRFDPTMAEAHCGLAHVLEQAGDFKGALHQYELGHEVGSKRESWNNPSAVWILETERMVRNAGLLNEFEEGTLEPESDLEAYDFALAASWGGRHALAVRSFEKAQARDPLRMSNYYHAAIQSAVSRVVATELSEAERLAYAERALTWLQADLRAHRASVQADPEGALPEALKSLQTLKVRRTYAHVRDEDELQRLGELSPQNNHVADRLEAFWEAVAFEVEALVQMEIEQEENGR